MRKRLIWIGGGVVALALLVLLFVIGVIVASHPQRSGAAVLADLNAPVRIIYDERGVPHIYADNEADAYRALGFVHAKDRLWQMELVRRVSRGELSDLFGMAALDADTLFRTLQLRRFSERYMRERTANLDPALVRNLQAYLEGVNAQMEHGPLPLEFRLLGAPRRPFDLADIYAVAAYTAYTFMNGMHTDPTLTFVRDSLGPEYLNDLAWDGPEMMTQAKRNTRPAPWAGAGETTPAAQRGLQLERDFAPAFGRARNSLAYLPAALSGSNAWAISASRSESGYPILCNDPHISFAQPAVWYEAHLIAPGHEIYGHFLALLPLPLVGHSREHAWGVTMLLNDDVDFYLETPAPGQQAAILYRGQVVPLEVWREQVPVKGRAPVTIELRSGPHGPIINRVFAGAREINRPIAMRWGFLDLDNNIAGAFHLLARASGLAEARTAASMIRAPGLNVLYANRSGDIAWWAAGRETQIASNASRAFLLDGESGRDDVVALRPFEENPHQENPPEGMVVSGNNRLIWGQGRAMEGYPSPDARALRIRRLLSADLQLGVSDMKRIQLDIRDEDLALPIRDRARLALAGELDQAAVGELLQAYWKWDGEYRADSAAPMLHWEFCYQLLRTAMYDELGEVFFGAILKSRVSIWSLAPLLASENSPWWDDRATPDLRESRKTIVRKAMLRAIAALEENYGRNWQNWRWDQMHTVSHGHALGRAWPLDRLLNVGPWPAPGGRETINNYHFDFGSGVARVTAGPSTRRIVDLAAPQRAFGILPTGQSGHPFEALASDQAADHLAGRWRTQAMDAADIKEKHTIMLLPER